MCNGMLLCHLQHVLWQHNFIDRNFSFTFSQEYGPLLAIYVSLFAIILLKNPSYFYSFVDLVAKQYGKSVSVLK